MRSRSRDCKKHGVPKTQHGKSLYCDICHREYAAKFVSMHPGYYAQHRYRSPNRRSMTEAKDCSLYLGVVVAERALSRFFDNITRMPYGNPGYDFVCGKGFKIDVKSSCLYPHGNETRWVFMIYKNQIADYFLCIGFDNRKSLKPMRVWLIPGNVTNHVKHRVITNNDYGLNKWVQYERPLDRVLSCCDVMRTQERVVA